MLILPSSAIETDIGTISAIGAFLVAALLEWKYHFLKNTLKNANIQTILPTMLLSLAYTYHICTQEESIKGIGTLIQYILLATPAVTVFLYWFYKKVWHYFKRYITSLETIEKGYLITATTILTISIIGIYNVTNVFYEVQMKPENYKASVTVETQNQNDAATSSLVEGILEMLRTKGNYDILYTTDTGTLLREDCYINIGASENNLRQPLFGVFSMPFHILPRLIADCIPQIENLYAIIIAILQGILICIAFTLLARLMQLKGTSKVFFLTLISITYPTLLFLFNLEQYIMAVFYLIVFLYMVRNKLPDKDIAYIAMTGSMLTSGILFPLLGEKANWKNTTKNILATFLKGIAIAIIAAKGIYMMPSVLENELNSIQKFSNTQKYTVTEKIAMYTNFLQNTLLFDTIQEEDLTKNGTITYEHQGNNISIQPFRPAIRQVNNTNFSIIGILIGILACIGFLQNRKDPFTQICFSWITFSAILLCLIGWGIAEDGLILYSFYFSWAFLCLAYKCIETTLKNHPKAKYILYSTAITLLLATNLNGIIQIIQFGIQYYPK